MEKILIADLSNKEVVVKDYDLRKEGHYGRGLAMNLIEDMVPNNASRYSKENALVLVPGLLTGCKVASSCRLMIATKKEKNEGIQLSNTTGNFPQKLASLSFAGVVVKGIATEKNTILHISKDKIEMVTMQELENTKTSGMIKKLKERFGSDSGIVAVGKSADMQMSLSTFVCTYPDGEPEYHCPRSGFGDVFGSKNLRAVVVTGEKYFARDCEDDTNFVKTGKELARLIIDNEICGGALPAFGSVTLIRLLKDKEKVLEGLRELKNKDVSQSKKENNVANNKSVVDTNSSISIEDSINNSITINSKKTNFCCAPMCVIGCLNRHSVSDGEVYSSPDESEVREALKSCFNIDDYEFTREVRSSAYELGIVGTEFVTAAKVYFEATGIIPEKAKILELLDEIDKGSVVGRLVASRTFGISRLYKDNNKLESLLDRKAIQDERDFEVSINKFNNDLSSMSDMDLLYAQIFVLENLGFCIFSSFATVNNEKSLELMAKLFTYKTGIEVSYIDLINYARECMKRELEYEARSAHGNVEKNIPPFTKVLYRYFAV